jgi:gluconate 2-dehydrogenase
MKPKILVTREVFDETLAYLAEHCEVEANQPDKPFDAEALAKHLKDKDGVVCCLTDRIDAALLAACPRLKVVANIAVGYNNIEVPACTARGVKVTNTPGVLDDSTADLAWTLILATARRLTEAEAYVRAGNWQGWHLKQLLGVDVHHATLGVIGMGRIGRQIVRRAAGFKMRVLYHNRNRIPADVEKWLNAEYATKDQLLAQSDFVVLQVPYSPATHHYIGAAELKKMKPTAILINSTRGGVVDDAALIDALKNGRLRAAGLDVFESEPRLNPGFLELKNVVLAPHVGSSTEATRRAMAMTAAKNAVAVLIGGVPPNLVNPEAKAKA